MKKKQLDNYYGSIRECSIYSWNKVKEYNNFAFLCPENLNKNIKDIQIDNSQEGEKAFMKLLSEYFIEFGLSDSYKKEIKLRVKIINLNCEYSISGDRVMLNEINLLKKELIEMQKKNVGSYDKKKEYSYVASKINRPFNDKQISVFEYNTLLNS